MIQGKGVKIKKDGEKEALDIYYNNLGAVNVGDKVYIKYTSGSILVVGKVHSGNTDTGGGSSTGVTKEYVDTQDAELSRQINVLSTTHGYVNSNSMGDFNVCVKNGKYIVYFNGDGVEQHAPPNIVTGDNTFAVDVTQQSDTVLVQEICGIYGPNQGRKFYRVNTFGTWTDWQQPATTTKTDISFPYNSGFKDESSTWISFIEQGSIYTRVVLNLTGSNGTVPKGSSQIATLPVGSRPIKNMSIVLGTSDASKFCKGVIYATGVIAINNPHDGLTYVEGSAIF